MARRTLVGVKPAKGQDIYLEQYVKTLRTEAKLVVSMARTLILPGYQEMLFVK